MAQDKTPSQTIALNKKARYDYFIDECYEAGVALQGWEVKALRAGRLQLKEGYVFVKKGEAWLFGAHILPLSTTSTHFVADPTRTRRLLLHRRQIDHLIGAVERKGYTLVPLAMFRSRNFTVTNLCLARGKKQHDKRADQRDKDWQREKSRLMKHRA